MESLMKNLKLGENVLTREYLKEVLGGYASSRGIKSFEIESYTAKPGSNAGENFLSDLWAIDLVTSYAPSKEIDVNQNEDDLKGDKKVSKSLSLMFKCLPPERIDQILDYGTFQKEADMYRLVLPALLKHQEKCGINNPYLPVAKCYHAEPEGKNAMVVLENLKVAGYKMPDSVVGLDLDHIALATKELARLHAIGYSFIKENPEKVQTDFAHALAEIVENDSIQNTFAGMQEVMLNISIVVLSKISSAAPYVERLKNLQGNVNRIVKASYADSESPIKTICHGDSWLNNFMYRYESKDGKDVPVDIKILDWQISRYNCPINDLVFMIYSGTTSALRKKSIDDILKIYHQTFVQTLKSLNQTADITFEQIKELFQKRAKLGLAFWLPLTMQMAIPAEKRPNGAELFMLANASEEMMKTHKSFQVDHYPPDAIDKLIDMVKDAIEYGII